MAVLRVSADQSLANRREAAAICTLRRIRRERERQERWQREADALFSLLTRGLVVIAFVVGIVLVVAQLALALRGGR